MIPAAAWKKLNIASWPILHKANFEGRLGERCFSGGAWEVMLSFFGCDLAEEYLLNVLIAFVDSFAEHMRRTRWRVL